MFETRSFFTEQHRVLTFTQVNTDPKSRTSRQEHYHYYRFIITLWQRLGKTLTLYSAAYWWGQRNIYTAIDKDLMPMSNSYIMYIRRRARIQLTYRFIIKLSNLSRSQIIRMYIWMYRTSIYLQKHICDVLFLWSLCIPCLTFRNTSVSKGKQSLQ